MQKTRIKDKKHLEQIFKQFAKNNGVELTPNLIIAFNSGLTFKDLQETCEVVGYENLLLDSIFTEKPRSHCDAFYIDLIGIKEFSFRLGVEWVWFFGGKTPDELIFENDGTLRVLFD